MSFVSFPILRALALCALVPFGSAALAHDTIKIGFPMSLSGTSAQFGHPILSGAKMYVDAINAQGGVLGKKLELVVRDSQSDTAQAAHAARELVEKERVDFLVGSFTSDEGVAISAVAKELKTVFLALAPKADRLTSPENLHAYVFRLAANSTTESRAAAAIVARWNIKRIATIAPDYSYGRDSVTAFVAQLKKLRPDVKVVDQQWPRLNEKDYGPHLRAQIQTKPDAVFSVICCGNFYMFSRQAHAQHYFSRLNGNLIAVAEAGSNESLRLGRDYPLGMWANTYDSPHYVPRDPATAARHARYIAQLKAYTKDGETPSWASQGYLGIQFLVGALKKAGSQNTDKVATALLGLELETPFGAMTLRAKDHQLTRGSLWGRLTMPKQQGQPILFPLEYIDPKLLMD